MVAARTPARRGPTFVCARRRGLCSMSGRYPYGIGNPPTLRRSSFPQRALRPAGGPIPKHTWGCAPRPPNAQAAAGYERCKHRPYGAADTLSRCLRRILFWTCRNQIKNQPYKRRRVGRNLRLSRADPALCSGQPSPLRCILLSPQGLATLRGPRLYGAYRRVGASGTSPSDFWLLFFIEK